MEKMQSIEPNIADLVNGWFKSYCLDYKFEIKNFQQLITLFFIILYLN